jgi:hypothetical protein
MSHASYQKNGDRKKKEKKLPKKKQEGKPATRVVCS